MQRESGASAILVAFAMVLLLGMAALAIDVGFGLNERRGDVTAADTGVMAGAVSVVFNDSLTVDQALEKVRLNLDTTYSNADWQAIWEACTDPGRLAFDPGTGVPVVLSPLNEPASWGSQPLDCISQGSSFLRVRVPDQLVPTHFARIWGAANISTNAAAVAVVEPAGDLGGLIPFGISGNASAGELCLKSSGLGTAYPPCTGPTAGAFGEINSEIFGDFFGTPSCSNPGHPELEQNIALGVDHFVSTWPGAPGAIQGTPHPGDGTVNGYALSYLDACRIGGGTLGPEAGEAFPVNTMQVRTGFSPGPVENGLMSDNTYLGNPSRLQRICTAAPCASATYATRDIVKLRHGANNVVWELDNVGPWAFLTGSGTCDGSSYNGLSTDQKITRFANCLQTYSGTTDIFTEDVNQSGRFAWAPQYWFQMSTTGLSYQPVLSYRMVFIGGVWFNCNASTNACAKTFYPDEDVTGEICDAGGGANCNQLSLDQMSAWMFPDEAIPDSVRQAFPGGQSPFLPGLFR